MLADNYPAQIERLISQLESRIQLPDEWATTFFTEADTQSTTYDERRRFTRFSMRTKGILAIRQTIPAIPRAAGFHVIYTFNVARGGFGFLHADELFPCEMCDLWLPTQKLTVEVTRSQYINDNCYFTGAQPTADTHYQVV